MSHTASLAGNHRIARQVLAQAGVVEAEDFKEMIDLARTLAMVAPRNGARVAILTFSGGAGIVSADAFEGKPLTVAELSKSTKDILKAYFPPWMPVSNPVDLWPAMEVHGRSKMYSASVKAVLRDPGVDAILMHAAAWDKSAMDLKEIAEASKGAGKPVFIWYIGQRDTIAHYQAEALELKIPAYLELSRAIDCMASAFGKEVVLVQESGSSEGAGTMLGPDLRRLIETHDGPLDEYQSKRVLATCGIPVVDEQIVQAAQDLEPAASRMGYPVVLKGLLPGEVHKTERGLVRLNVANRAEAAQAHQELTLKMGGKGAVLLQKQVSGRVELICGLLRDSQFGPCVMLGVGGIMAEVIDDAVFAMAPLSRGEALGLIGRLRSQRLLDGFRGGPSVNRDELAGILVALGELGLSQPRVREVDINPLVVTAEGLVPVDANLVLGS